MQDRYINPFVDYGFKKLFGTEENKDLLIRLLNALIGDEKDPVKDLNYKNVERIGEIVGTRTNYFDVYCSTASGREFIVEMQNSWKPFFKDRILYYAAKPICDQGKRGIQAAEDQNRKRKNCRNKGWDSRLEDVYVVALMNFELPDKEYPSDSYLHKVQLLDVADHHVFYDKLTLIYVELPKLDHVELDLSTDQGKWLYALNSLYYYDEYPEELEDDIFKKLFRQAELSQLSADEDLAYERSMKVYLDVFNDIEGARILGHRKGLDEGKMLGIAEGKELGIAEGELKAKRETAEKMLSMGMDLETVLQATGLSKEDLQ
ncbi:MAG: PD-(D/E)XK nuclease family transposase [Bacteroidales bacterium]|nr:PD-(D/E)XK nuclease family transposase [Bacteroidales bacterium]